MSAYVSMGPMWLPVYLDTNGRERLPASIQDDRVRHAIAVRLREMALVEHNKRWRKLTEIETEKLTKTLENRRKAKADAA